jgi:hypothetical protein
MVVTVEPPVFIGQERLGDRIIDNVIVSGTELLSLFSRDLIVLTDCSTVECKLSSKGTSAQCLLSGNRIDDAIWLAPEDHI